MKEFFSVHNGWLIPCVRAMQANGIDPDQMLADCQIPPQDFKDPESRISADRMAQVIEHCNQLLNRHDFAIEVAKQFHPNMFHALGYSMLSSNTLKDAFLRASRYKKVVSNTCLLNVKENSETLELNVDVFLYPDSKRPIVNAQSLLAFMGTLLQFAREALNKPYSPLRIYVNRSKPHFDDSPFREFFGCELIYDSDKFAMEFDLATMNKPLMGSNPLLTQSHEKLIEEYILRLDKSDIVQLVTHEIKTVISLGTPSQTDVAKNIGMSLRSLQRKLNDKHTNFRQVLEDTRRTLALDYISQHHLTYSEIGYLVGFSSISNFNRAFKRWTQCTPSEYRSQH